MHGERLNSATHLFGLILSLFGICALAAPAWLSSDMGRLAAFGIYGATLVLLYAASTLYHSTVDPRRKRAYRLLDHSAIYLLIAGSYTPLAMVTLKDSCGWTMLCSVWGMAALGLVQELLWGRRSRRRRVSMAIYVVMSCAALFAIQSLSAALPTGGLAWLGASGLAYLIGVHFYINGHKRHYHGIWHMFVIIGSASHFLCLLFYVA